MIIFVLRRVAQALPVLFLSSIGVFLLLHLLPGDPAILMAGPDAPQATIDAVRQAAAAGAEAERGRRFLTFILK